MIGKKLQQPQGCFALTNGRIILPQAVASAQALVVEAGKDADIAIFEDDFSAWRTMIRGQWAYAAT